jgi:hypothetical protein
MKKKLIEVALLLQLQIKVDLTLYQSNRVETVLLLICRNKLPV